MKSIIKNTNHLNPNEVSILVATYNHEDYIEQNLESLIQQEFSGNIKVFVYDDCSTDYTAKIVKNYQDKYPHIIKFHQNPSNFGSGFDSYNFHKVVIKSGYWSILNGDDYLSSKNSVQKRFDVLSKNKNLVGCGGITVCKKNDLQTNSFKPVFRTFNLADIAYFTGTIHDFYMHTGSLLWRNIYHSNITPLPPRCKQVRGDPAIMMLMMGDKLSIHNLDEIVSVYRITGKGLWTRLSSKEQKRQVIAYESVLRSLWPIQHKILFTFQRSAIFTKKFTDTLIKLGLLPTPINFGNKTYEKRYFSST